MNKNKTIAKYDEKRNKHFIYNLVEFDTSQLKQQIV